MIILQLATCSRARLGVSFFCPTCGVKYSQERSVSMSFKLVNCIILNVMAVCDAYMPEDSEWSKEFKMLYQNVVNVVNTSLNLVNKVCEVKENIGCAIVYFYPVSEMFVHDNPKE